MQCYLFRNFLRSGFSSLSINELNCLLSNYSFPQLYTLRSFGKHLDKTLFSKFLKGKINLILGKPNQQENADIVKKVFGHGNESHKVEMPMPTTTNH